MGGVEVAKKITLRKYFNFELPLKVSDVFGFDCKFIFILESPEMDEVQTGHPACGSSGRSMSKIILPIINEKKYDKFGFGFLISKLPYKLKSFGVMNVCNYPLQFDTITMGIKKSLTQSKKPKITLKTKLTEETNNKSNSSNSKTRRGAKIVTCIYEEFKVRMNDIENKKDIQFIPCGKFARAFFEYYRDNLKPSCKNTGTEKINYPDWARRIPHPSYGHWDGNEEVKVMVNKIK